jgi:hypothetical protein
VKNVSLGGQCLPLQDDSKFITQIANRSGSTMKNVLQLLHRCLSKRRSKIVAQKNMMLRTETKNEMAVGVGENDGNNNKADGTIPSNSSCSSDCNESATYNSKEYDIAMKYIASVNAHDGRILREILSPSAIYDFDGLEVLGTVIVDMVEQLARSFPDFHFAYKQIKVLSPGVVMICNVQVSGTHTGAPYTFGPYEEIDATGMKVQNDPEDTVLTIDMENELIKHFRVTAKGPLNGPQGFYEQLGGLII